ncbi:MAG: SulP family inorganic anion transporter [Planctomycetota bacterium]|nr:MAG: SulP family inorganic anion transporter [Planctomycetota bacterium]
MFPDFLRRKHRNLGEDGKPPGIINFFKRRSTGAKDEILSGITVSLALVPEAVAFAFLAGVHPLTGLYAAFVVGLMAAVFGGRPGMISGATGAMAVVIFGLVREHGVDYLFPAVVLAGMLQISVGALRLGKLIRLVPYPVMLGFVNGLAIVILLAQFESFKIGPMDNRQWMDQNTILLMSTLIALTMAIIVFLPRLTKAVPAILVAIVVGTLIAYFAFPAIGWSTPNLATMLGGESLEGRFPPFNFPSGEMTWATLLTVETLMIILPYAVVLAGVGLIESLMTLNLIDEITETRGSSNRECVGQGLANVTSGLFSGMGGCAMIGQSLINVNSGGRRRLSGIVAAVMLLIFILFAAPLIEKIPLAVLVGVMFMVVIGTFEWASLRMWRRIPTSDFLIILVVTLVTVFAHNLALAVLIGVVLAALVFAWQHSTHLSAITAMDSRGIKTYQLHGPLFFASVNHFTALFNPADDPAEVAVDFYFSRVYDQSALEAISSLSEKYQRLGKKLYLRHLSPECRELLDRARNLFDIDTGNDPHYHVSIDGFPAESGRMRAKLIKESIEKGPKQGE